MNRACLQFLNVGLILGLTACQAGWEPDPNFGKTINEAIAGQLINPNAPDANSISNQGLDGISAKATIDNYQRSFQVRPLPGSTGQTQSQPGSSQTNTNYPGLTR